jgi:hypothetical protein
VDLRKNGYIAILEFGIELGGNGGPANKRADSAPEPD